MFRNLGNTSSLSSNQDGKKGSAPSTMSPTLRSDIYSCIDQVKPWLIGGPQGQVGDGISYKPILTIIQKHFPSTTLGVESIGNVETQAAVIVGGVTNMVLEMMKWPGEGMAGGMALRTWVDVLVESYNKVGGDKSGEKKAAIARGITKGVNQYTNPSLISSEFTTKIQIVSSLKSGTLPSLPSATSLLTIPRDTLLLIIRYSQRQDLWSGK
ncbi:hypothetical protein ONZ45_g6806 [Pleurotus djamor]|nr:hypothetical protein ONZ45_g6806 [Pleurotus djamor]